MKVDFLGFQVNRQHHQDWAFEIITETAFEQSFLQALFRSDCFRPKGNIKQMQPIAAMLSRKENGMSIMVSAENFGESALVKAEQRITELEQALNKEADNDGT